MNQPEITASTTAPYDHAEDPAVRFLLMGIADYVAEMNDGDDPGSSGAPFGCFARVKREGNTIIVRPDTDPENWADDDGPIAAPTTPVVRITVERIA